MSEFHDLIHGNYYPVAVRTVTVPGFTGTLQVRSRVHATGSFNRVSHVTILTLIAPAGRTEQVIKTHAILAYQPIPDADKRHTEKIAKAVRKLTGYSIDVDETYRTQIHIKGE